jgi:endonuclease/exonuclease/phosphatase family metal-dependent hydrolase
VTDPRTDGVAPAPRSIVVRVLSYNVRSMRDDRAAVARVIRSARPDVVCIQEAPRLLRWRSKCAALARTSGLVVVGGGRSAGANLILSTLAVDVLATADVRFSADPGMHRRGTSIAVLSRGGAPFAVAGTHLDLKPEPRLRHVAELHAAIEQHVPADVPVIVAGDINDHPGSAVWSALAEHWVDAYTAGPPPVPFTSPAREPRQTIDGIFVDPRLRINAIEVIEHPDAAAASDHLPVLVEVEVDVPAA